MNEQWQELKETIIELRDNDGTCTQQEVCRFLANLIDVLEKQMQDPCDDAINRQAALDIYDDYNVAVENGELEAYRKHRERLLKLPSTQPKTGYWIHFANSDDCSECGWSTGKYISPSKYCPNCGCRMNYEQEME